MMRLTSTCLAFLLALPLAAAGVGARQDHSHHGEALGTVHFETSCSADVNPAFTRAVALLHSFGYEEARRAFQDVAARDARCAMAHWGIAMSWWHPLWAPPTKAELSAGEQAATKAKAIGGRTPRERAYIEAIGLFYDRADTASHQMRAVAYRERMMRIVSEFTDDVEASIFYALSLLATASPGDLSFANQKRAAEILNRVSHDQPAHPGVAHYMIHAFDYPPLAAEALPAARAYARIAPASPHALHMPTHIFTRLGLWQESISGNLASAETARKQVAKTHPGAASFDALHALDYLVYAYLQIDDQEKARAASAEATAARRFDEPSFAAGYAIAAIPARLALERHDWKAAAALDAPAVELPWQQFPYALAITHFTQAVGAARIGQLARARASLESLRSIQRQLTTTPVPGPYDWAGQVESMRLAASAWVSRGEGRTDEALTEAGAAAELEEKVGKHPVTPGPVLPAREMLGNLLLELDRPGEALKAFELSLRESPNRFNSLAGAALAAVRSGQRDKAADYYRTLLKQVNKESKRPEVLDARAFLKANEP
jgi:tetratricopeptide (TPR) repeat protein